MSSVALLRPGVVTGACPEQQDVRDSFLDRAAAQVVGFARQRLYGRKPHFGRFVRKVQREGEGLDRLSEEELALRVADLRRRLYGEGLTTPLVARSFALIREFADRRLKMRHYDVQLFGGWVMLRGMIAEMETGEGKTLAATLPAATAALAGVPVHIVTVNDFLVQRDAEWMGPIYRALGLSVGTITEDMDTEARRRAYACDVTYCTNKHLVFDYLKDRLLMGEENRPLHLKVEALYESRPRLRRLMMRGLCFAIVDEADSVLIDEARTPLIISKAGDTAQEERAYGEAVAVARKMVPVRDFIARTRERQVDLTELGKANARRLTRHLSGIWLSPARREELLRQALAALHLYHLDKHYLIEDERIRIVDEYTGRVMADRSWERGLHQMIEAKEDCPITGRQETLARISYQKFFRRYLRLGGMTGTAREVAGELWSVYRLNVVSIPTNRPSQRKSFGHSAHLRADSKWRAVVDCVTRRYRWNQPILIGTRSVAASEHLSALLDEANIPHRVLNARQDKEEAEIITQAGQLAQVTVATNMAGRGTDIVLGALVGKLGGLHVLATERHEARRIDRQLYGRCGRQGDPGTFQSIVSMEDELARQLYGELPLKWLRRWVSADGELPNWLGPPLLTLAQIAAEFRNGQVRRSLLRADDSMDDMLAFSGRRE